MKKSSEVITAQRAEQRSPQQQKQYVAALITICSARRNNADTMPRADDGLLGYTHNPSGLEMTSLALILLE